MKIFSQSAQDNTWYIGSIQLMLHDPNSLLSCFVTHLNCGSVEQSWHVFNLPPPANDSTAQGADAEAAWLLSSLPFLQRRCALGSFSYWSYTTTGSSTSLIWRGFTLTGVPQSKEVGDPTGSEAGPFGGTLRTIFQFMWVDLFYIVCFELGKEWNIFITCISSFSPVRGRKRRIHPNLLNGF